ncbi:unnamed protein product [Prorocentrum cordatum]|uniref:Uncharacterized protein n=1 Tax=Prorocentrum cordatum TaxID=2364126 RepID=A0ABN9UII5_9DINO|nr:unnamed protein product [Polarella glacialis]
MREANLGPNDHACEKSEQWQGALALPGEAAARRWSSTSWAAAPDSVATGSEHAQDQAFEKLRCGFPVYGTTASMCQQGGPAPEARRPTGGWRCGRGSPRAPGRRRR